MMRRNSKKRVVAFFLTLVIMAGFSYSVCAAVAPPDVEPTYIVSCDGGAKHRMVSKGMAVVKSVDGSVTHFRGACTQCSYCHLVLGSQFNPFSDGVIGQYAMYNPWEQIYSSSCVMTTGITGEYWGSLTSDSYWSGFQFVGAS